MTSEKASSSKCPPKSKECRIPIGMNYLTEIKQTVTSHVLYSPFVKEMVRHGLPAIRLPHTTAFNYFQQPWKMDHKYCGNPVGEEANI